MHLYIVNMLVWIDKLFLKLIIVLVFLLGSYVVAAQEIGFFGVYTDSQEISLKPTDIVETSAGDFLILANEIGGYRSKILKIDPDGVIEDEIVLSVQDSTLKLNNLILVQDATFESECYMAIGSSQGSDYGRSFVTIWVDIDLNILKRVVEPFDFPKYPYISKRFIRLNNSVISAFYIFDGQGHKDHFLVRLSEEGRVVNYKRCDADSLLMMSNIFPIHGEQNKIGMFAITSNESSAMSGVHVFDSVFSRERSVYFPKWHTIEDSVLFLDFIEAHESMMAPISGNNYVMSSQFKGCSIQIFDGQVISYNKSVILAKLDNNFQVMHDSVVIGHYNDSTELPATHRSVVVTADSCMYQVSLGNVNTEYPYIRDLHLIVTKTDMDLNVLWQKRYLREDTPYFTFTSTATDDGGLVVIGHNYDYNINHRYDLFVMKINPEGMLDADEITIIDDVVVYPNPGNCVLNISTAMPNASVEVYDALGRLVHQQKLIDNVTTIDTRDWMVGIYVWKVIANDKEVETGKWIKN